MNSWFNGQPWENKMPGKKPVPFEVKKRAVVSLPKGVNSSISLATYLPKTLKLLWLYKWKLKIKKMSCRQVQWPINHFALFFIGGKKKPKNFCCLKLLKCEDMLLYFVLKMKSVASRLLAQQNKQSKDTTLSSGKCCESFFGWPLTNVWLPGDDPFGAQFRVFKQMIPLNSGKQIYQHSCSSSARLKNVAL